MSDRWSIYCPVQKNFETMILSFKVPFTEVVAFAGSVDQDQAAQNVQPDLRSTLSVLLEHYRQTMALQELRFQYFSAKLQENKHGLFRTSWTQDQNVLSVHFYIRSISYAGFVKEGTQISLMG